MSLALKPSMINYCRRMARFRRWPDPEDVVAQGILGILLLEAKGLKEGIPPDFQARRAAWDAMRNYVKSEVSDKKRQVVYLTKKRELLEESPNHDIDIDFLLSLLNQKELEAVYLHIWEDLTETEMASRLGCSVFSAKSRYFRALQRIRSHFPKGFDDAQRIQRYLSKSD